GECRMTPIATHDYADNDTEAVDLIAVERCVAGTLRAKQLTAAERDYVVGRLFRLGYPNPEIVHRTGIALADIRPILLRLGLPPQKTSRLVLRAPGACTAEQAHRARHLIAARSHGADEARDLLLALGLVEQIPVWTPSLRQPPHDKSTGRADLLT